LELRDPLVFRGAPERLSARIPHAGAWLEPRAGSIPSTLPPASEVLVLRSLDVAEAERHLIRRALERTRNNRTAAAALLGIHARTLRRKLREMDREPKTAPGG
jgi:DNA-binding NtrC family response regulator